MNTKRLITASIFSLISASTALAADVMIPHQPASSTSSSAIVAPTFSWTGLYLGVHAGGFSSKADMAFVGQEKSLPLDKEFSPKLSGFAGGFYAGSNIDLGDNFIFGVDTDLMLSGKKHTKSITIGAADNATIENAVGRSRRSAGTSTLSTQPVKTPKDSSESSTSATSVSEKAVVQASASPTSGVQPEKTVQSTQKPSMQTTRVGQVNEEKAGSVSSTAVGTAVEVKVKDSKSSVTRSETSSVLPTEKSASSESRRVSVQSSPASLGRSDTGERSSAVVSKVPSTSVKSEPKQQAEKTPTSSATSTKSEASHSVPVKSTSGQPSLTERTLPSTELKLARSGESGSGTKTSNGTNRMQHGSHHSAHGGGYAHSHGGSHAAGYGSSTHAHGANPHGANPHGYHSHGVQNAAVHGAQRTQATDKNDSSVYGIEQMKIMASELGIVEEDEVETVSHTFKQNWGGATRVRIGFAADRFMPYLAGGIAYGQFQDTVSISVKGEDGSVVSSKNLTDETKTMIGYTLGGGVDFAVLDNVIVRAEYRYSDFGKKKFAKEKLEVNYKTNDFRVGVAYKF